MRTHLVRVSVLLGAYGMFFCKWSAMWVLWTDTVMVWFWLQPIGAVQTGSEERGSYGERKREGGSYGEREGWRVRERGMEGERDGGWEGGRWRRAMRKVMWLGLTTFHSPCEIWPLILSGWCIKLTYSVCVCVGRSWSEHVLHLRSERGHGGLR